MSQTLVYYTYIHTHIHTYMYTYIRVHIHTCMHTYMHTHIHTCTHTLTERQHPKALVVLQENKLEVFDIQSDPVPLR